MGESDSDDETNLRLRKVENQLQNLNSKSETTLMPSASQQMGFAN
jgi:hypothetical protein